MAFKKTIDTMPTLCRRVAIYIRVSTNHQIDRDSLPLQREELINYAKYALNIEDYEVFEDAGFSAKNTDRSRLSAYDEDDSFWTFLSCACLEAGSYFQESS